MVKGNTAYKLQEVEAEIDYSYLPDPLKYTSVSLKEVFNNKLRLEASALVALLEKVALLENRTVYK
ncbi:MAG: hypothetical protein KI790_19270 [Cyclobacteriaceae bacterium]|nr:hypothetical protein [Cyclobacteriaceae bacterium HetDA_MAG_MS6]